MGVKDKKFWYYRDSLKSPIFRGMFGGFPKKEGLDSLQI